MTPVIQLRSGAMLDLRAPDPSRINIDDIAYALSHLARYTGHASRFLSVAEHCVHVSLLVPTDCAREALLHDASEAFCGDVSAPLKMLCPDYRLVEERLQRAIAKRFDLRWPMPEAVKSADLQMLAYEARACMPHESNGESRSAWAWVMALPAVAAGAIERLGRPPEEARRLFLNRAEEVGLR